MGILPLGLQMIPWCFHVSGSVEAFARVVGPNGRARMYRRPVSAGEVVAAHPLHLLCPSDALIIGQPVPSLAPADRLLPGRTYFLLPAHLFRSALSFASLAACLGEISGGAIPRPIEIRKIAAGKLQVRVSDEYLERLRLAEEEAAAAESRGSRVCTTEGLAKDYKQLVRCHSWKPKLETIKESDSSRRAAAAAFTGIARKRN